MPAYNAYSPYSFNWARYIRGAYAPGSLSEYVAAGENVPDTTIMRAMSVGLTRVRLWLAVTVPSDATWTTTTNFTITPSGGAAAVTVSLAAVGHDGSYIDLVTTSHTASGLYNVAWAGLTGIADGSSNYTPTALPTGRSIVSGVSTSSGLIVGNSLPGGTISYKAGTVTATGNTAYHLVS